MGFDGADDVDDSGVGGGGVAVLQPRDGFSKGPQHATKAFGVPDRAEGRAQLLMTRQRRSTQRLTTGVVDDHALLTVVFTGDLLALFASFSDRARGPNDRGGSGGHEMSVDVDDAGGDCHVVTEADGSAGAKATSRVSKGRGHRRRQQRRRWSAQRNRSAAVPVHECGMGDLHLVSGVGRTFGPDDVAVCNVGVSPQTTTPQ